MGLWGHEVLGDEGPGLWGSRGQSPATWSTQLAAAAGPSRCKQAVCPPPPKPALSPLSQDGAIRTPHFAVTPTAAPLPMAALCAGAQDNFTCVPAAWSGAELTWPWAGCSPAGCAGMCLCRGRGRLLPWGRGGVGPAGTQRGQGRAGGHPAAGMPCGMGMHKVLGLLHGTRWGARGEGAGTCRARLCACSSVSSRVPCTHTHTHSHRLGSLCSPGCGVCTHRPPAQSFPVSQHPSGAPTTLRPGVLVAGWASRHPSVQATQHCSTVLWL